MTDSQKDTLMVGLIMFLLGIVVGAGLLALVLGA